MEYFDFMSYRQTGRVQSLWETHGRFRLLCSNFFGLHLSANKSFPSIRCQKPGLNEGPLDLQSKALRTELFRQFLALSHAHRS